LFSRVERRFMKILSSAAVSTSYSTLTAVGADSILDMSQLFFCCTCSRIISCYYR
jgi:hypothetical protein